MKKIHIFRNMSKEAMINYMQKDNNIFHKRIGLMLPKESSIAIGSKVDLPSTRDGTIVATRRRLFFFWRKQYLIEQETKLGKFYTWYNEEKIYFK